MRCTEAESWLRSVQSGAGLVVMILAQSRDTTKGEVTEEEREEEM